MAWSKPLALRIHQLAKAAYDVKLLPADWQLIDKIQPKDFGLIARQASDLVIAFRGTEDRAEWLADFSVLPVPYRHGKGQVHLGFQEVYESLHDSIYQHTQELAQAKRILITGHSLGAALAIAFAANFQGHLDIETLVYTFAGPRFGDVEFAEWFDALGIETYRIVNKLGILPDPVPHVPSQHTGFRHVGLEVAVEGARTWEIAIAHDLWSSYGQGLGKLAEDYVPKRAI